ncbi:MAG TPA: hypothetical protein VIS96_05115 [Terrimicrobiaceae bacterium]
MVVHKMVSKDEERILDFRRVGMACLTPDMRNAPRCCDRYEGAATIVVCCESLLNRRPVEFEDSLQVEALVLVITL